MPDKMRFETKDLTTENVARIAELFPGVVTEGKVNFDLLRSQLDDDVFGAEAYEFTWVGKREAIAEARRPIRMTLRPCREESEYWDTTENLYIEGDNLDVLKLLQESYLGKIKMIYIDPPYNTGKDSFIYHDNFTMDEDEYDEAVEMYDEDGLKNFHENSTANPRYHSVWCSMMYPRLVLGRNLLRDDGVIFISIDDCEQENLKKMCDEVFGASNFVANCVRKRRKSQANLSRNISPIHEYVLIYAKKFGDVLNKVTSTIDENSYKNPDNDPRGAYTTMPCTNVGGTVYSVTTPTGKVITEEWRFKRATYDELFDDNRIVFPRGGDGKPRYKLFLSEKQAEGVLANTWFENVASNQEGTREIKELFGQLLFDNPKPVGFLKHCLQLGGSMDGIILDFFSGSATSAHAVMQLNAEDGGHRKFIMVQCQEVCDKHSDVTQKTYKTICDIGKDRIRLAGAEIKSKSTQTAPDLDVGFRVLKLADTNMTEVYYNPGNYTQDLILSMENNIKPDRNDMDLLYGCLLDWGLPLSMPHTHEKIDGFTVHTYNGGDLIACFNERISEKAIREIAGRKPLRAVFRDSSFTNSSEKINVFEIFKQLAPNMRDDNVRVI